MNLSSFFSHPSNNEEIKTPDWCLLKKEGFIINFKEINAEKIDSMSNEIEEFDIPAFMDEKFQENLKIEVNKIKEEIESLQFAGIKLEETFRNLGKSDIDTDNPENNEDN